MPDCSFCIAQNSMTGFRCGWCSLPSISQCLFNEECAADDIVTESSSCPQPMIRSITPSKGPPQGTTIITISGRELGVAFTDIINVTVADLPCTTIESTYIPGLEIACVIAKGTENRTQEDVDVIIYVRRSDGAVLIARGAYSFVNPVVKSVVPNFGPASGGTRIRVTGRNLDAGNTEQAIIRFLLSDNGTGGVVGNCIVM